MGQLSVEAEGTTQASSEIVWSLVADANTYPRWGPWNDGGYRPAASGPSQQGQIQWFRYGRTTSVEKILEVEETSPRGLHRRERPSGQKLSGRGDLDPDAVARNRYLLAGHLGQHDDG